MKTAWCLQGLSGLPKLCLEPACPAYHSETPRGLLYSTAALLEQELANLLEQRELLLASSTLEQVAARGFKQATPGLVSPRETEAHLSLLFEPLALEWLLRSDATPQWLREWLEPWEGHSSLPEEPGRWLAQELTDHHLLGALFEASSRLWVRRQAPLHREVFLASRGPELLVPPQLQGQAPRRRYLLRLATPSLLDTFGLTLRRLPQGVAAFDLEVETAQDLGLRPRFSPLTSAAVATREATWLLGGDEPWLLGKLLPLLRELGQRGHTLVGWSSETFDLPVLALRAAVLGLPQPALAVASPGPWASVAWDGLPRRAASLPSEDLHSLLWRQGESWGLKAFALAQGWHPKVLAVTELHEASWGERLAYGASDALCTLAAAGLLL